MEFYIDQLYKKTDVRGVGFAFTKNYHIDYKYAIQFTFWWISITFKFINK